MSILYPQVFILLFALLWIVKQGSKKSKILYLSLALLILALSRPVLPQVKQDAALEGKEFIIALDVSYSMHAKDVTPNRLAKAKEIIRQILKSNPNDRFTLFAFTTNPLILCPSTSDHQLLILALNSLKVDNILTHGTSLQKLFDHIHAMALPEKNLILLSDGGEEKTANTYDINLISIAMASKKGSTLQDPYNRQVKDKKGHLIISRQNPLLKEISNKYFYHDSMDFSLAFVKQATLSQKENLSYYELFWIPLLVALTLFLFFFIKIPKKVLALLPFLALHTEAGLLDWYYIEKANNNYHDKAYKEAVEHYEKVEHKTIQSQMNIANAYYQAGAYTKAKTVYKTLKSTNPRLKKRILFKLGNCAAKLEDYESAKGYYLESLAFGKDEDILYNLKQIAGKKREDKAPTKSGNEKEKVKSSKSEGASKNAKKGDNASDSSTLSQPLGFKAYELINKGYIDEKKPW